MAVSLADSARGASDGRSVAAVHWSASATTGRSAGVRLGVLALVVAVLMAGGVVASGASRVRAINAPVASRPLLMGGGSNLLGNDPDSTLWPIETPTPQSYPGFWGSIGGAGTAKQQGDAYASDWCDIPTDGCSGVGDGKNLDFSPHGYYYTVDVTGTGTVNLQAFDPAFVSVGQFCQHDSNVDLSGAATLVNVPGYPEGSSNVADIQNRYAETTNLSNPADPGLRYCTGDQIFANSGGQIIPPGTTYTVWKATVPGVPASSVPVPGCNPLTYPGFVGDLQTALGSGLSTSAGQLSTYFRQWVTLCEVTGNVGDEFFIEVSTGNGAAANHFSLRGVTTGGAAAPVDIAGNGSVGIFANVHANQATTFNAVRVPSADAGDTVMMNLFDIGDAASVGSLQLLPPTDSNVGATFADDACQWTGNATTGALGYAASTPSAPWGNLTAINNCQITGVNSVGTWNAQWSTFRVSIPAGYTCDDATPHGCWITIAYLFAGSVHDATTWSASLLVPPARVPRPRAVPGDTRAAVSWPAVTNTGTPITGYVVTPSRSGAAQTPVVVSAPTTSAVIGGLTNAASYTFTVAATNAAGTGPPSLASTAIIVGAPAAPTSIRATSRATATRTGSIIVTDTPGANNGAAITKFTATCSSNNGGVTKAGVRVGAIAAPITIAGVTAAKTYACTVTARNSRGTSPLSAASNAVTVETAQHIPRSGYWMLGADGQVYAFANAINYGRAARPSVAIATRRDGTGYWIVNAVGNVSNFGSAANHGGHPALSPGERIATISATPSGHGYWLFTDLGRAFPYGDAHAYGDMSGKPLNGPIIASAATPTGHGYYMVGSDGGMFTFGDAKFRGSMGGQHLNEPVVGLSPTPNNSGYWLVASDGGVFAFNAPFRGSMGGARLNDPVNGLVAYGNGYLMVASDGGVFDFSDKPFAGSLGSQTPPSPIIGIAAFST